MPDEEREIGPGDSGPCPRCGVEMAEKEYDSHALGLPPHKVSGRYWHMLEEHGIFEDYNLSRIEDE